MPEPDLLTVTQAASLLGVTGRRVRALIAAGHLPATRYGLVWLIRRQDVATHRPRPPGRKPRSSPHARSS